MSARPEARIALAAILLAAACARTSTSAPVAAYPVVPASSAGAATPLPAPPPARWLGLLGEYGDGALFRRLLGAYGVPHTAIDDTLGRRFLAYALLHKYSKLSWYLERVPPPPSVRTLDALAREWWC